MLLPATAAQHSGLPDITEPNGNDGGSVSHTSSSDANRRFTNIFTSRYTPNAQTIAKRTTSTIAAKSTEGGAPSASVFVLLYQ